MHLKNENIAKDKNESENLTTTTATFPPNTTSTVATTKEVVSSFESHATTRKGEETFAEPENTSESIEHMSSFWPPKENEFVLALLEDGFYIAHVKVVR